MSDAPDETPSEASKALTEGRGEGGRFVAGNSHSPSKQIRSAAIKRHRRLSDISDEMVDHNGVQMPCWEAVFRQTLLDARSPDPVVSKPARDFVTRHLLYVLDRLPENEGEDASAAGAPVMLAVAGGTAGTEALQKWIASAIAHLERPAAYALADSLTGNATR